MSSEIKHMKFVENSEHRGTGLGLTELRATARHWEIANKDSIQVLSAIHNAERDPDKPMTYKRTMIVGYTGDPEYENPQTCDHSDVSTTSTPPSCHNEGVDITTCNKCLLELQRTIVEKLEHEWLSNKDGTHTCSKCGDVGDCDCTEVGQQCSYCGYIRYQFEIITELINMVNINTNYPTQQLVTNLEAVPDGQSLRWEIINGQFPDGITFTDDGKVTGIPTVDGTYNVEVQVSLVDNTSQDVLMSCSKEYSITITLPYIVLTFEPEADDIDIIQLSVCYGNKISILPTVSRTGYTLEGWYDADGNRLTTADVITEEKTYYARYTDNTAVVTFNTDGGTCSETTRTVAIGANIGELPTPTFGDYIFGGWYTSSTGGLRIDENYVVQANVTLYARWSTGDEDPDIVFGDATTQFNVSVNGDRTNFNNNPYTIYGYNSANTAAVSSDLEFHTGFWSNDMTSAITSSNPEVKLYLKVINNGASGSFRIGFDADSYIVNDDNDRVSITRLQNGLRLGNITKLSVTVPYSNINCWAGTYSQRTTNRLNDITVGTVISGLDTGYAFTINDIYIPAGSYTILEVSFKIPS